jgi:hypothetical protein
METHENVYVDITEMSKQRKLHQILNKLTTKYGELSQPTGLQPIYDKQNYQKSKDINFGRYPFTLRNCLKTFPFLFLCSNL